MSVWDGGGPWQKLKESYSSRRWDGACLVSRQELAKDADIAGDGQGLCGVSLACNGRHREEVDSVLAEAEEAGAKLLKPAQEAFWGGYSGIFRCARVSRALPAGEIPA